MCDCGSNREIRIDAKTNDMCAVTHVPNDYLEGGDTIQKFGYVPRNIGIGGGDYVRIRICLDCKKVINFPILSDEEIIEALDGM